MLDMRPSCETCDRDLPADEAGAVICSFECTFCETCATDTHKNVCPNCGGAFQPRPIRDGAALDNFPASTRRIFKGPPGT
ncbi:DUF1272 domain-containing protein [Henriciella litoralis]|uniref:DUF1272 domain-containing protein n=1 Tax=Henriciella litoralis TaxID=568102 RepID=UPI000A036956|nr:DUF1272 domain-containing protein [Henriciella litoralis]